MKKNREILIWMIPIITTIMSVFYIGTALKQEHGVAMQSDNNQIITSVDQ